MAFKGLGVNKLLTFLPIIGVIYAIWQDYGVRGIAGLQADLNAFSFAGLQAKGTQIITGVIMIAIGYFVARWLGKGGYNKYLGVALETIFYYSGTRQILAAVQAGRGVGGAPGRAGRTVNAYNPMALGSV